MKSISYDLFEYINQLKTDADYITKKINSDLTAYEGQLETYTFLMSDIIGTLEKIVDYIQDTKRIDKQKILSNINNILKEINNNL